MDETCDKMDMNVEVCTVRRILSKTLQASKPIQEKILQQNKETFGQAKEKDFSLGTSSFKSQTINLCQCHPVAKQTRSLNITFGYP